MRLLFISANTCTDPYPVYPLALSYLSAALKNRFPEIEIDYYDVNLDQDKDLKGVLIEKRPDYVAISLRNVDNVNIYKSENYIYQYRKLVKLAKKETDAKVIVGGAGFSIYPKKLFEFLGADFGNSGEGENTLGELIEALEKGEDHSDIEGLVYKKDGKVIENSREMRFTGIDFQMDERLADFYWKTSGMMNVQTKRGCPFKCIYCSYPVIEGKDVRTLDPEKVVQTIKNSVEKGRDYFFFTDSVFNISPEYNRIFAQMIIDSGIKMKWGAYFRPHGTSYEDLELFKKSGLTHIEFGTESLCDPVLEKYGKSFNFEQISQATQMCYDLKIYNAHFLILGGYGETDETIKKSFENSSKLPWTVFFPFVGMRIYPKTRLKEIAIEEGIIKADDTLMDPVYYTAKNVNLESDHLKSLAATTGKRWVFSDEDNSKILTRMKKRGRKGPLWEFLVG
jgi:radical SAM superfamily enzyme YgiQ (UPF0313 family)